MNNTLDSMACSQGFAPSAVERLPIPQREAMSEAQRIAADTIINGPRKAIFGPFIPLLQTPTLMERIGKKFQCGHRILRNGLRSVLLRSATDHRGATQ